MASIREYARQDGTTTWRVLWRDAGKQTSLSFPSEAEAKKFKAILEAHGSSLDETQAAIERAASTAPTVQKMLEYHLSMLTRPLESTVRDYRAIIKNHLAAPLGGLLVSEVTDEHIAAWVKSERKAGFQRKTIANAMGLLSSAFKRAVRKGWRGDNPCEFVTVPKDSRAGRRQVFLEHAEFELLLAEIPLRHQLLVEFLVETGLRFSEATALTWDDLHLLGDLAFVEVTKAWKEDGGTKATGGRGYWIGATKGFETRDVSITRELANKLAVARGDAPGDALVFPNRFGSQLRSSTFHAHAWQPAVRAAMEAGLRKRPRPHDLRHTHAAWLLSAGVEPFKVSRRLGHASVAITERVYGHLVRGTQVEVVEVLDQLKRAA